MDLLIVEDEKIAVRRLIKLLGELWPGVRIAGTTDTISGTVKWLKDNPMPDLSFFDIQLADGSSFEIFKSVEITCPVIFITAYDEFALKAFEVNSIDYLLKPVEKDKLLRALKKYDNLKGVKQETWIDPKSLQHAMEIISGRKYKERFVIKYGEHLRSIPAGDICCFLSESKATFIVAGGNKKYIVEYSMDHVMSLLDPEIFFRINRKFIVRLNKIKDIIAYSNSRLKLVLHEFDHPDLIVAREKVQEFRQWLDR